jgi:DNA-binding NarL/FixJ family response regulator
LSVTAPRNGENRIKVLLVEDHPVVAEGLSSLLQDYDDLALVGVAGSVAEVAAIVDRVCADVAVIDYHLPDGTGTDAADVVRARCGPVAIVFLSADESDERLIDAIEAGATSYVLKSARGEEIVGSIRAAAAGQTAIPAGAIASALAARRESARQRADRDRLLGSLTPREHQILALMISGADNLAMAETLQISYATVRTHVRSILAKLGAHSQLDAVAKASQWGFGEE